jgi:putative dimethyl sulfoxide reductase chaperone
MENESRQGGISILLANRAYLYRLLQNLLGNEPAIESIQILSSEHTQTSLSLLSLEVSLDLVRDFMVQFNSHQEDTLDKARSEYTRLFIGPTKLPAPPWESVYVTKDRLIFQESTLKVRQWYLKYSFLPVHYRSEADDHIALELDFMYNLSCLADTAFDEGNFNEACQILKDQKAFLEEHLLIWVPQFVTDLEAATSHSLYRGMASLLIEFLKADLAVTDEILDSF